MPTRRLVLQHRRNLRLESSPDLGLSEIPSFRQVYSLVRKGSMGTPAEVLQAFRQKLRGRTRVIIDHPDLPDALKQGAARGCRAGAASAGG